MSNLDALTRALNASTPSPALRPWAATHHVIFIPARGKRARHVWEVMLDADGFAYQEHEWRLGMVAEWRCDEGEWSYWEDPTPFAAPGALDVKAL